MNLHRHVGAPQGPGQEGCAAVRAAWNRQDKRSTHHCAVRWLRLLPLQDDTLADRHASCVLYLADTQVSWS